MRMHMAHVLLAMLTSGCATAGSDACPREVEYSRQQQEQAADEQAEIVKALGREGVIVGRFMPDYGRLRDQARACRGEPAGR